MNPTLPDWPVVCFYNMSKRRGEQRNWYALPYDERRRLIDDMRAVGKEQLEIAEINVGIYSFRAGPPAEALSEQVMADVFRISAYRAEHRREAVIVPWAGV